jgi:feruloyl esterase
VSAGAFISYAYLGLDYASLTYTTSHGFAAVATNNGHNGTEGKAFYQNTDVVHDFADRSIHASTVIGKALVKQFYGSEHKKSYFLGCSQGGRQGIANAMKFPGDFDGIVAGAPALDFNNLVSWRASFFPLTGPSSQDTAKFITPDMWSTLIHDEVLRQCDHLDGVADGIIEYPDLCQFQPEVLQCKPGTTADGSCLNDKQIDQVRRVFAPFTYDDGTMIYPGMQLGSEQRAIERLYAGRPFSDSRDWFKYVVYSDPTWDPTSFTTADAREAQQLNPFDIRTFPTSSDLAVFRNKGGKILSYHGMQDQQITGHNTARWVEQLRSQSSDEDIDEWLRYFRISGLLHCSGGPGAWMIGQTGGSVAFEPQKNVLSAVVEWVENSVAPDILEGTKLVDQSKIRSAGVAGVQFTRKHCRYGLS